MSQVSTRYPSALPGPYREFAPKTGAGSGKGIGPFSALSVSALPGPYRVFDPKPSDETGSPYRPWRGGIIPEFDREQDELRKRILMEDDEIMVLLATFLLTEDR